MSSHHEPDHQNDDTLQSQMEPAKEIQEERGSSEDSTNPPKSSGSRPVSSGVWWKVHLTKIRKSPILGLALLLSGLAILIIGTFLILQRVNPPAVQTVSKPAPSATVSKSPAPRQSEPGLPGLLGAETSGEQEQASWLVTAATITLKLALAGLLGALLAFRPHREIAILQRNPYVAQTQILLAVVAAALMMIVADNAARAFGIFAAASLVRFRTNIRDPKEITVLLMSLAIGLASGVGKIEVAIILTLFSLLVLSVLEYYEPQAIFRAMELTVTSRKVEETDQMLRELFEKRHMTTELRKVDREDPDNPMGKIVYYVNVNGHLSTDKLSEEIFSSDPDNVDSITWDQKKTSSYVYK